MQFTCSIRHEKFNLAIFIFKKLPSFEDIPFEVAVGNPNMASVCSMA